jgi:hypothetical protein
MVLVEAGGVVDGGVDDGEFPAGCSGGGDDGFDGSDEQFAAEALAMVGALEASLARRMAGICRGAPRPTFVGISSRSMRWAAMAK